MMFMVLMSQQAAVFFHLHSNFPHAVIKCSIYIALHHLVSFNVFQILFKPILKSWNCRWEMSLGRPLLTMYHLPKQFKLISAVLLAWLFLRIVFARILSKSNPC